MFILERTRQEDAKGELKLLYKMIEKSLGFVPSHFELFATIDIESMKEFILYNQKMSTHKKIDKNLLPILRLEIARRECREYCVAFNTDIVEKNNTKLDIKQELLMKKVLKAIYETQEFCKDDLVELYKVGFEDKDYFDLLSYSTNFMAKSKLIEIYTKRS